jgi:GntR family transcriptional regulator
MSISTPTPTPQFLYQQLLENIEERVRSGKLKVGDLIPSETKLQEEFNISRVTVRKALMELEQRGLVTRKHGKGTYISEKSIHQALETKANTIVEAFELEGVDLEVTTLALEYVDPPEIIAELFGTSDQQVVCLSRAYSSKEVVIGVVHLYLPLALSGVAYILKESQASKDTSYRIFENQINLDIGMVSHQIKAVPVGAISAAALGLEKDHICLTMDRITRDTKGTAIEFARFIYAPYSASFEITLPRHASPKTVTLSKGESVFDCPI